VVGVAVIEFRKFLLLLAVDVENATLLMECIDDDVDIDSSRRIVAVAVVIVTLRRLEQLPTATL